VAQDVVRELRALIERGYSPSDRLPSEAQLARNLDVSRATVREALSQLLLEGQVVRRWGVGTFVNDRSQEAVFGMTRITPLRDMLRGNGLEPELSYSDVAQVPCDQSTAEALRIDSGDVVWRIDRVFAADGTHVAWLRDFMPLQVNDRPVDPTGLTDIDADILALVREQAGVDIDRMDTLLRAVVADGTIPRQVGLPVGLPLIRAEQTSYGRNGEAVISSDIYYNTQAVALRLVRTPADGPA